MAGPNTMSSPLPVGIMPSSSTSPASSSLGSMAAPASTAETQTSVVKEFATLLGTTKSTASSSSKVKAMMTLLSPTVTNQDVILTLPSLDLKVDDEENGGANPLPKVGEHRATSTEDANEAVVSRPLMEASVLTVAATADDKAEEASKAEKASLCLKEETQWTKSTLIYASLAVATNVSNSFSSLVDSRVRAWTLLLLKHSLSTGDSGSRSKLLQILQAIIKVNSAETKFKTLPLPEAAAGQPKEEDVILPLLFEAVLHITIQDRPETVTLRAPGTISANFSGNSLSKVQIQLDTSVMLSTMVDQARVIVFKAVATATRTEIPAGSLPCIKGEAAPSRAPSQLNPSTLAGFKSALNLTSNIVDKSPRLQKARSSALRLNGVLHGEQSRKEAPALGMRKNRSVKWDTPLQMPKLNLTPALTPAPKKQKSMADAVAKLKSFKSFGRAHAGDFGSGPRNATFGEYGGRQAFWGRDGRLANHPTARQAEGDSDMMGMTAEKNATFDLNKPRQRLAAATAPTVPSSLPRTATALENWLVKKSTKGGL